MHQYNRSFVRLYEQTRPFDLQLKNSSFTERREDLMADEKPDRTNLSRRGLLKSASFAGVAAIGAPLKAEAQTPGQPDGPPRPIGKVVAPGPNKKMEEGSSDDDRPIVQGSAGSDYMVDVLQSLGLDQLAANPGTSFRGLHESLINYSKFDWNTCTHEEASVAMAHGYAKVEGRPMLTMVHGTVGLQHASMAIYNAWCDRVPVYIIAGNTLDAPKRGSDAVWEHSVQDAAVIVRDYVKWDDTPISLEAFGDSAVRAYKIATTPPMAPTLLVLDSELQERPLPPSGRPPIPKLSTMAPVTGDPGALAEVAQMLLKAEHPVIIADRNTRTQAGIDALVELAETLHVPICDTGSRMNFPTRHKYNMSERSRALVAEADLILGLEMIDFFNATHSFHDNIESYTTSRANPKAKLISISATDLFIHANYQDFMRYQAVDLAIPADSQSSLPYLTEAVRKYMDAGTKSKLEARGDKLASDHDKSLQQARKAALMGWDASPVSTGRLCAEVFEAIRDEDWSLASTTGNFVSGWPQRLWDMSKHYHNTGAAGGSGIGYCAPAAAGAAVANKKHGRITVSINPDGDLMYSPGVLWTAANSRLPILYVMHNNRAYHQEIMGIQRLANRRQRGIDRTHIGVTLRDPFIDYATLAKGLGVTSFGPITDPKDLGPTLKKAVDIVKGGEPVLMS
jgi:acetolactate synthase I/II/III large subunit